MNRIGLAGLCRIDLPDTGSGAVTVRLTDGGVFDWGGDIFAGKDPLLGTLSALEGLAEGAGEEVPALRLTVQPPMSSTPAMLAQPGWQQARVRLWLAEFDRAAGTITGSPDLLFDGQLDQCVFVVGRTVRHLESVVVSGAERLLERNSPSALSPVMHKQIWSGETGNDNATGLTLQVAWGIENPAGATGAGSAMIGGGGSSWAERGRWQQQ